MVNKKNNKEQEIVLTGHQDDWGDMTKELDKLREDIYEEGINEKNWDKIRKEFLEIWTPNRISNMTLQEYTDTDREYSFTYWVENVLNDFGNIHGSTSIKFGVYLSVDGDYKYKKSLLESKILNKNEKSIEEAIKKYKENINQKNSENVLKAFFVVRENLKNIVEFSGEGKLKDIDKILEISPMFKWKVAFLYNVNWDKEGKKVIGNRDEILPIYSRNKLVEVCKKQGVKVKDNSYPELYSKLLDKKRENIDIFEYFYELWKGRIGINEKKTDISIYQISKNDESQINYELLQIKSEEDSNIDLFSWDDKKFKNHDIGDLVFFVNPNKGEILITKIIEKGYKLDLENKKLIGENEYSLNFEKGYNIYSLKKYADSRFVIFKILDRKKEIDFNGWRNIGAGNITYVKDLENDKRFKFIADKFKYVFNFNSIKFLGDIDLYKFSEDRNKKIFLWGRFGRENLRELEDAYKSKKDLNNDFIISPFLSFLSYNQQILNIIYAIYNFTLETLKNNQNKNCEYIFLGKFKIFLNYYFGLKIEDIEKDFKRYKELDEIEKDDYFKKYDISSFDGFLKSFPKFDNIYLSKLSNIVFTEIEGYYKKENDVCNEGFEGDQNSYSIGLFGKWGKGKTTLLNILKAKLKKDKIYDIYEIDVWKGYSNIGNKGEDKLGLIKYMLENLLDQLSWDKKIFNFFSIKYLKNKLYNNIHIGNQYYVTFGIVIFSLITSLYLIIKNETNFDGDKFLNGTSGIFDIGSTLNIGLGVLFIYFFLITLIKNSNKTKVYDKQITDLNLARKDAEKVEKILNLNIDFLDILSIVLIVIIFVFVGVISLIFLIPIFNFTIEHFGKKCIVFIFILFLIFFCIKKGCNNFLRKNKDKRNIIILENIDRLNPDQIVDVLDLAKTVLDFENTIYLFPVDHYLIYEGLKFRYKDSDFDPIDYVDKIINLPLFVMNPYISTGLCEKELINTSDQIEFKIIDSIFENNKEIDKYLFDFSSIKDFIEFEIANHIPRKIQIIKKVVNNMGEVYNIGVRYYGEKININQKLFIFFLLLRYTDIKLFMKIEQDIDYLRRIFKFIKIKLKEIKLKNIKNLRHIIEFCEKREVVNNSNKTVHYKIFKNDLLSINLLEEDIDLNNLCDEIITVLKLLDLLFTSNNFISILDISREELKGYMDRVYIPNYK